MFEAIHSLGIGALSRRVGALKREGYPVMGDWEITPTGKRVVRYKKVTGFPYSRATRMSGPDGYAVVTDEGAFVGCWRDSAAAVLVANRSKAAKSETVKPVWFAEEVERLRKENDVLRGLVQCNPKWRCTYGWCRAGTKEPLASMAECPLGFPGCACSDDLLNAFVGDGLPPVPGNWVLAPAHAQPDMIAAGEAALPADKAQTHLLSLSHVYRSMLAAIKR